jgi:benzoyl-CoA reductase/2-hydroxyglutaryl-CoA dehydratase subunit BcrC/BadD/HgdB
MEKINALQEHLKKRIPELYRMKDAGIKIIGYTPGGYMPDELVYAAGAVPAGLINGGSPEAVAASAQYLPRWFDTFCRSQIGHRMSGNDPLYEMVDLLVVPVTDNNIRVIGECWNFFAGGETFRFGVPHEKSVEAYDYYLEGLHLLKDKLEEFTGNKITDVKLREQITLSNRMWECLDKISTLRKTPHPPISGEEFVRLNHASFYADKATLVEYLESLYEDLKGKEGDTPRARILLTGSTLAMGDYKILSLTEQTGAAVIMEEFAEGVRHYWERVNLNGDDLMASLADRYFNRRVPPAWFRPSRERIDFIIQKALELSVDGVIWYQLMYRDGYDVHSFYFEKALKKETGLKMLKVESDYDHSEVGPLRTRVETFIDTIGN